MTELGSITQTVLTATAPFDLECSLRAIAGFQPGLRDVGLRDGGVCRAFSHPTDPSSAVVTQVGERDDGAPGVALTVFSERPLDGPELDAIGTRVTDWLGLQDDRAEFLRIAEDDDHVRPLLAVARGLHQVRFSSLAEGVVYFTLVQNSVQWYAALRKRRLTIHLGTPVSAAGEDYTAFPEFPVLTRLTTGQLMPYVGPPHKAARLAEVAAGVAALDEERLRHGPYEEAKAALLSVRGIGEFTAHALLLRALGRPDEVPLEMEQYRKTAASVYGAAPPSAEELRERYGRWIGWWAYTCRVALTWLEQEKKARERADRVRARVSATRRPRTPAGSSRPRKTGRGRQPGPWSPSDPGPGADAVRAIDPAPAADAGPAADAAASAEAALTADAGRPAGAGPAADAGCSAGAGSAVDAGCSAGAGPAVDAGQPVGAGPVGAAGVLVARRAVVDAIPGL